MIVSSPISDCKRVSNESPWSVFVFGLAGTIRAMSVSGKGVYPGYIR
ncbi:hypothetical protein Salmuc_01774 [Salipiger mucosus DSM 16094]|uniref:Uncharacterized protein n=1 Tax=Salipiger mucosus DSM 16094 TaxID=1123237 RepID=S9SCN8_9RHOB|nr:hypothetical protein Salmuc_01774 [Salipiger mucosus DSM 16094]